MKLGIMQPYFMPYIGYFQLMKAVDKYVVYDDVNYIKGGWVSRNNILVNGEKKMFTITLNGASPNKYFNEISIRDDFKKLLKTLQMNYSKAIYYHPIMELLERVFAYPDKQLALFLANSFREILAYLNVNTEILMSSDLPKDCSLKGKDKVIHMCKLLDANQYYNTIGGQNLYDKEEFALNDIQLSFVQSEIVEYSQFGERFIPGLSIIDVLMFNSKESVNQMLDNYKLI